MVYTHVSLGIDWNLLLGAEQSRSEHAFQLGPDLVSGNLGMTEHQLMHAHSDEKIETHLGPAFRSAKVD